MRGSGGIASIVLLVLLLLACRQNLVLLLARRCTPLRDYRRLAWCRILGGREVKKTFARGSVRCDQPHWSTRRRKRGVGGALLLAVLLL